MRLSRYGVCVVLFASAHPYFISVIPWVNVGESWKGAPRDKQNLCKWFESCAIGTYFNVPVKLLSQLQSSKDMIIVPATSQLVITVGGADI